MCVTPPGAIDKIIECKAGEMIGSVVASHSEVNFQVFICAWLAGPVPVHGHRSDPLVTPNTSPIGCTAS